MKTKILAVLLTCILLSLSVFQNTYPVTARENTTFLRFENEAAGQDTESDTQGNAALDITARAAVLIENTSGQILYEKEKDTELVPASITKIMTLLLIFEAIEEGKIQLTDQVSVSEYAASMGGSQVFLEPGETQTVDTMIKCISIASANDAAVAMAEKIAGSESAFVEMMNQKAEELGMKHTSFKNCNGLDDTIESGHFSSAYDVALMSVALLNDYPEISNYSTVWMDEITHITKKGESQFGLTNTNKLIRTYDGITGLKTGSTSKAKYCLSATATRNGVSLTAVIMAAPDHKVRFSQAAALLDYGFANCTAYSEKTTELKLEEIPINGGKKNTVIPRVHENFSYTLCQGQSSDEIQRTVEYKKDLKAPLNEGETIGRITYKMDNQTISEIPILAAESIEKAKYTDCLQKLFQHWFMARQSGKY